jgi:hypothetical protein
VQEPNTENFRVLQQVNYHLTYGDRIVFQSPSIPPLPTVVTGRHGLRFKITQPVSGFELPVVSYFVKVKPPEEKLESKLRPEFPDKNAVVAGDVTFRWTGVAEEASVLKFSVHEQGSLEKALSPSTSPESLPDSNPLSGSKLLQTPALPAVKGVVVFSAALPVAARQYAPREEQIKRLRPGVIYVWQIQALDASGKIIMESDLRSFRFAVQ